jgi:hypothetical protein
MLVVHDLEERDEREAEYRTFAPEEKAEIVALRS